MEKLVINNSYHLYGGHYALTQMPDRKAVRHVRTFRREVPHPHFGGLRKAVRK